MYFYVSKKALIYFKMWEMIFQNLRKKGTELHMLVLVTRWLRHAKKDDLMCVPYWTLAGFTIWSHNISNTSFNQPLP